MKREGKFLSLLLLQKREVKRTWSVDCEFIDRSVRIIKSVLMNGQNGVIVWQFKCRIVVYEMLSLSLSQLLLGNERFDISYSTHHRDQLSHNMHSPNHNHVTLNKPQVGIWAFRLEQCVWNKIDKFNESVAYVILESIRNIWLCLCSALNVITILCNCTVGVNAIGE